ncbi:CAP domain-containing protein [Streptomyces sp. NPDC004610]|uniref:CAP domain-containing protein n=1 Tax=unclassified Streptomyces TaxID=2593676 RepID=UPI0033BEA2AB
MGRHRRSDAGRAARDRATGGVPQGSGTGDHGDGRPVRGIAPYLNPEAYAESAARSEEFLYATDDEYPRPAPVSVFGTEGEGGGDNGSHRRPRKKGSRPVRTGLLGVSAAVALGTVAVATGVVPGTDTYRFGGDGDRIEAADTPTGTPSAQGGTSGDAESPAPGTDGTGTGGTQGSTTPGTSPTAASPEASAGKKTPDSKTPDSKSPGSPAPERTPEPKKPSATTPSKSASQQPGTRPVTPSPSRTATKAPVVPPSTPARPSTPGTVSQEAVAAAEVLRLVNVERAAAGCSPVAANSALSGLAQNFSEDMAARGFFDHTDPDGDTPWDRAAQAGIAGLGGENIARGQADAAAVMDAWMNSEGHRANILNCDFTTLGVGVEFGSGGPWWTQNFGY